jgi:ABC-type sugar transport system ATPase subunit
MRDGHIFGTWDIGDITIDQLISQMVGRDMQSAFRRAIISAEKRYCGRFASFQRKSPLVSGR